MIVRPLAIVVSLLAPLDAQDWPQWRGPAGDGYAPEAARAPLEWSREQNVRWKTPLALPANGSPVVAAGRVYLTTPEDPEGRRRSLYCYDAANGEQLWVRTVDCGQVMPTHETNPYGGSTPAVAGDRVVVWHATAGLHCYSLEGEELWQRDLGEFRHMWGYGTSPLIRGGRVFLHTGPGERSFVTALDLETGETVWETEEPRPETSAEPVAEGQERLVGSWSTPVFAAAGDRELLICGQPTRVVAYDSADGSIAWWCGGVPSSRGDLTYSSPVVTDGVCVVVGGYVGPLLGVLIDGEGDVTETERLWHQPEQMSNCASGIGAEGLVFLPDMSGMLWCIDPLSGDVQWRERVGRGGTWGSIVSAEGRLYIMDQRGTTTVFVPSPDGLEVLAKNELGEQTNSTPAFADGAIFLRTHEHLYCIAAPE